MLMSVIKFLICASQDEYADSDDESKFHRFIFETSVHPVLI